MLGATGSCLPCGARKSHRACSAPRDSPAGGAQQPSNARHCGGGRKRVRWVHPLALRAIHLVLSSRRDHIRTCTRSDQGIAPYAGGRDRTVILRRETRRRISTAQGGRIEVREKNEPWAGGEILRLRLCLREAMTAGTSFGALRHLSALWGRLCGQHVWEERSGADTLVGDGVLDVPAAAPSVSFADSSPEREPGGGRFVNRPYGWAEPSLCAG